ncbi:hypothetical protein [Roseinatronobacter sp. NSM]|uniref:hypothetical protein n=1 Tax=Roseinatronobacter sp. NSM TaxID=3457785 RepID=UPI00403600A8
MFIDPEWTERRLIPLLAFDHPAAEPAWNGFLHSGRVPISPLAVLIKPLLVDVFPWVEGFSWDRDLAKIAAEWLGWMRIFQPDEPAGLTRSEMRSALRSMSDSTRNRFIFWLGRVGQKNEIGWAELVVPFIENEWQHEKLIYLVEAAPRTTRCGSSTSDGEIFARFRANLTPIYKH